MVWRLGWLRVRWRRHGVAAAGAAFFFAAGAHFFFARHHLFVVDADHRMGIHVRRRFVHHAGAGSGSGARGSGGPGVVFERRRFGGRGRPGAMAARTPLVMVMMRMRRGTGVVEFFVRLDAGNDAAETQKTPPESLGVFHQQVVTRSGRGGSGVRRQGRRRRRW